MIVRDEQPAAVGARAGRTRGPTGSRARGRGFLARVRVEDYGPGRIRPHERTHPGPKEDRLRLTRATKANLSPIFSLFDDPAGTATEALARATTHADPWGQATDDDGTVNRAVAGRRSGHDRADHRRAGARRAPDRRRPSPLRDRPRVRGGDRRRGPSPVRADVPGRARGSRADRVPHPPAAARPAPRPARDAGRTRSGATSTIAELESTDELAPTYGQPVRLGYIDAHFRQPFMLTLKDPAIADAALADHAEPYRRLDTAVLEALILKGALRDDRRRHRPHRRARLRARLRPRARARSGAAARDAAFFVAPTPIEEVRAVAAAGESMPPKSTYFFPKVPTGLLFNPLRLAGPASTLARRRRYDEYKAQHSTNEDHADEGHRAPHRTDMHSAPDRHPAASADRR